MSTEHGGDAGTRDARATRTQALPTRRSLHARPEPADHRADGSPVNGDTRTATESNAAPLTRRQLRELALAQEREMERLHARAQHGNAPSSAGGATPDHSTAERSALPERAVPRPAPTARVAWTPTGPATSTSSPTGAVPAVPSPEPAGVPAPPRSRSAEAAAARAAAVPPPSHGVVRSSAADAWAARRQQAPVVAPPASTGAIRSVDATGQITAARPVRMPTDQIPAIAPDDAQSRPQAEPQGPPQRVGVREGAARAMSEAQPRVYPGGATPPNPAVPEGQRTPLASAPWPQSAPGAAGALGAPAAPSGWRPDTAPAQPVAPQQPAQPAQPVSWNAGGQAQWPAINPQAPSAPSEQPTELHAAVQGDADEPDVPFAPAWPRLGLAAQPAATSPVRDVPEDDGTDEDDAEESWLTYTPLQYLILVVVGLVLGAIVWQLMSASGETADALSASVAIIDLVRPPGA
ncbi:hypothetical protein GCM10011331_13080 [Flavimobilis marinus]|uniref:Uncharacterized protein n=1 Tax=Flavimobilis marinus TaxID=285351 RepID=A0A1I2G2D4_9MICO|nr:hypothetical protein [Flavimobilis marinus]GHG50429.1 hypothetical protein GCM10011331_13080 [Flavimobilis marinus]SFF11253.1 hypothetical protein SAMN04488035_1661 [Flavimobilis marinus]